MPRLPRIEIVAHIHCAFGSKFGIPRQSGLVSEIEGKIIFTPKYRQAEALRGIEGFSHLWLLWHFSENDRAGDTPSLTVRPPRLGGNTRLGVFATRSPFRPTPIGLSSVELVGIDYDTPDGPVLYVKGADLAHMTPILDIKPYLPFTDAHPEAKTGFTEQTSAYSLSVNIPEDIAATPSPESLSALTALLAQDPRPAYHSDPDRIYGFAYGGKEIRFRVEDNTAILISLS